MVQNDAERRKQFYEREKNKKEASPIKKILNFFFRFSRTKY